MAEEDSKSEKLPEDTEASGKKAQEPEAPEAAQSPAAKSPIRLITLLVFALCVLLFVWYVKADRHTPYSDQARIKGLIVPLVPRVAGNLTDINVRLHSLVQQGDTLFQLDIRPFELAVRSAEAKLDNTAQQVGARTATVKSTAGRLGVARAQLDRAQRNWNRVEQIMKENPGALSLADRDQAETALTQAVEQVSSAEADLDKAQQQLGDSGPNNPQLRASVVALEKAQLELAFSSLLAPASGVIESFNIDLGYYASPGQPLATFLSARDVWIQVDMRENNLAYMKAGNPVEFTLDVAPGEVFEGKVRSIGYGVDAGSKVNRGDLPKITASQSWLRDPQRFPVIIGIDDPEVIKRCRLGGQVDVIAYTGDSGWLNTIGRWQIRIQSFLSYVR